VLSFRIVENIDVVVHILPGIDPDFIGPAPSRVERMRAHAQALGDLRNRIAPLRDLGHRIPFEIVAEITFTHVGLLASNLGKKASTNLGAIQHEMLTEI